MEIIKKKKIKSFSDLAVYQAAEKLVLESYRLAKTLPEYEKFCRVQQIQRSSSSITANIAEGFGRYHCRENRQYCRQARGSLEETYSHVLTAFQLKQISVKDMNNFSQTVKQVRQLLNGYIRYLSSMSSPKQNR